MSILTFFYIPRCDGLVQENFRIYFFLYALKYILEQNNKAYPELQNDESLCNITFLCNITGNMVSKIANQVFSFEEKLSIYHEEIQNKQLQNFPTMTKTTADDISISEKTAS